MALTKIGSGAISSDAIDDTKIADNAISEEHLDATVITGQTELAESAADADFILVYDTSAGVLKKVLKSNITPSGPTLSSISPTSVQTGDGSGNTTFTITGTGFDYGTTAVLIGNSGKEYSFSSVTRDSTTQLTAVISNSSLPANDDDLGIKVTNGTGTASTLSSQISVDAQPTWITASGSLGTVQDIDRGSASFTIEATDPDSAGPIDFLTTLVSGSLPAGATLVSNGDNTATISGFSSVGSETTSTFTVRAVDAGSSTADRQFSITVLAPGVESFTSSGTFSVPSGVTSVDALVVAGGGGGAIQHGGGGGAGGLIFRPGFPVTPGGTVTVTVGCGGAGSPDSPGASGSGGIASSGQDSVFGTLTAKGGGGGGSWGSGGSGPGGSSGGSTGGSAVPAATQPTQPGDSGTYGFGNIGGAGPLAGGGGGGAGAAGDPNGGTSSLGGNGGAGKAYTIADGTTPVYYAGGGGGGGHPGDGGDGGQGGGGYGLFYQTGSPGSGPSQNGQANKGGGGGSSGETTPSGGTGGKGIVIVRY